MECGRSRTGEGVLLLRRRDSGKSRVQYADDFDDEDAHRVSQSETDQRTIGSSSTTRIRVAVDFFAGGEKSRARSGGFWLAIRSVSQTSCAFMWNRTRDTQNSDHVHLVSPFCACGATKCAIWNNCALECRAIVEVSDRFEASLRHCSASAFPLMHPVKTFHVRPALPERLKALEQLAYNLRWSWDHETINLFRRLDRAALGRVGAQPRAHAGEHRAGPPQGAGAGRRLPRATGLGGRRAARLRGEPSHLAPEAIRPAVASARGVFLAGVRPDRVVAHLFGRPRHPRRRPPQVRQRVGRAAGRCGIAVPEGLFPPVPDIGRLAAGMPPVQRFLGNAPASRATRTTGHPCGSAVEMAGRTLLLRPWHVQVGRITLVLLDANIPENPPDLQDITGELYGGDSEMRIRQEIVLGVGGIRALLALGLSPARLPHERGPLRVSGARADSPAHSRAAGVVSRSARDCGRERNLHDAHAGSGRHRRVLAATRSNATSRRFARHSA